MHTPFRVKGGLQEMWYSIGVNPLTYINDAFRRHTLVTLALDTISCAKSVKICVKLSQIEEYKKTVKKPAVYHRAWGLKCTQRGDFKGGCPPLRNGCFWRLAQPLATFWNLCGFRVPGNDILALDWGPNSVVVYSRWSSSGFCMRSAGLNERQSLPQKAKVASNLDGYQFRNGSGQLSGYDMPRNVDPSVKKGVGLKQLAYCML